MEISIDLNMLRQISFNDNNLLSSMLEDWEMDLDKRHESIEHALYINDDNKLFNCLHELKTSYQMVGCAAAIIHLEKMIHNISKNETDHSVSYKELKEMGKQVSHLIKQQIKSMN